MKFLIMGDIGRRGLYHVGDEAMTEVAISMLQQRGAESITLIATNSEIATELYGLPSVERIGFDPNWTRAERDEILNPLPTGDITNLGERVAALAAAVEAADVVVIAGGGNMNQRFAHHLDERLALARLARRFNKPLLVTSQTIGPQLGERERGQLREMLQIATAFGLRDDDSFELAAQLAGSETSLFRTADDGALFPSLSSPSAAPVKSGRYIVGSFTPDAGATGASLHEYLDWLAASLDAIASELDADALLIPHAGNLNNSAQILDELSDRSIVERSKSGRIRALPPMQTSEIMPIMADALLTISTRYHPVVFGPALGIPTVGITLSDYHTVRMRGALEPLGLNPFIVPFGNESLQKAAAEITGRVAEYRKWLEPLAQSQRSQQQAWWDFLATGGQDPNPVPPFPRASGQFSIVGDWSNSAELSQPKRPQLEKQRAESKPATSGKRPLRKRVGNLRKKITRLANRIGGSRSTPAAKPVEHADAPLLSVIIPVYNVEKYLSDCVHSVTSQSLKSVEIILIDDGSTDSSAKIARELAQKDERIRFYEQENRGLGAVRNRGLDLARGTYITFVDSDDVVPADSYREMTNALELSGSDLAAGGVVRLRQNGRLQDLSWSQELHDRDYSTTLAQTPRLLRDFYTWNKVFNRAFLNQHGFRFREGVLFEDQPVIAEVLAAANSIEVLQKVTYHWRLRGDGTSLTSDMFSVRDIESRREAVELTREALERMSAESNIWQAWYWTLLEHHFPYYLTSTTKSDAQENYDAVVHMIKSVLAPDDVLRASGVTTPNRVLIYFALTASKTDVENFIAAGGRNLANWHVVQSQSGVQADLPESLNADLPRELLSLSADEHQLYAEITSFEWRHPGLLVLGCRAGITHLPSQNAVSGSLVLVSEDPAIRRPLAESRDFHAAPAGENEAGVRGWCEFAATINLDDFSREEWSALEHGTRLEVTLDAANKSFQGPVSSSTAPLQGTVVGDETDTIAVTADSNKHVGLEIISRMVTSSNPRMVHGEFELEIKAEKEDFDIEAVRFKAPGLRERRFIPRKTAAKSYTVRADISWLTPGVSAEVTVIDSRGRSRRVHGQPQVDLGSGLTTATNRFSALRIERREDTSAATEQDTL